MKHAVKVKFWHSSHFGPGSVSRRTLSLPLVVKTIPGPLRLAAATGRRPTLSKEPGIKGMAAKLASPKRAPPYNRSKVQKRRWIVVFALMTAGITMIGVVRLRSAEPVYQGKPASFWLDHLLTNMADPKVDVAAFKAMGPAAVPFLVRTLKGGRFSRRERRDTAAFLIGKLGPVSAQAIPTLMSIYRDPAEDWRLRQEVRGALFSMGGSAAGLVPEFMSYLNSPDAGTQLEGTLFLRSVGPKAGAAVPALLKLDAGNNQQLAWAVADALWVIDRRTNQVLRLCADALSAPDLGPKLHALVDLRELGPAGKSLTAAMQAALQDPDGQVRQMANDALQVIDPAGLQSALQRITAHSDEQLASLIRALQTPGPRPPLRSLEALALFGPAAQPAVPALISILKAPVGEGPFGIMGTINARREAAKCLAEIGPGASAAVPALVALISEHKDPNTTFYCCALGRIGPAAEAAAPVLDGLLGNDHPAQGPVDPFRSRQRETYVGSLAAADALTRIVPHGCSNAIAVLQRFEADLPPVEVFAVDKYGLGRPTGRMVPNPNNRFCRLSASVALWRLGLEREPPVAGLVAIIAEPTNDSGGQLGWAIDLLGDIGPAAKRALPALTKLLDTKLFIGTRRAAAIAIGKIDPHQAARLGLPGLLVLP
ncbi:MAG: hypothetical protein KGS61_16260 [Verrucomicrobia bacterium]|nr:hypothetical protein [Verrucomicrobiota bacterium]